MMMVQAGTTTAATGCLIHSANRWTAQRLHSFWRLLQSFWVLLSFILNPIRWEKERIKWDNPHIRWANQAEFRILTTTPAAGESFKWFIVLQHLKQSMCRNTTSAVVRSDLMKILRLVCGWETIWVSSHSGWDQVSLKLHTIWVSVRVLCLLHAQQVARSVCWFRKIFWYPDKDGRITQIDCKPDPANSFMATTRRKKTCSLPVLFLHEVHKHRWAVAPLTARTNPWITSLEQLVIIFQLINRRVEYLSLFFHRWACPFW